MAGEPGISLLDERQDSLARVRGGEHAGECLLLALDPGLDVGFGRDLLDLLDGQRRLPDGPTVSSNV